MVTVQTLDVTQIEPRHKHPTIFKHFDELEPGESFIIENDHDPKPLYYELIAERGPIFTWEYLEKGPELYLVQIAKNPAENVSEIKKVDVTKIEPRLKHPTVFKHFDELNPGDSFIIENDHDPKPLYYEMIAERGNIFTWEYLEKGPEWFVVKIEKNLTSESQQKSGIAVQDIKKAELLKEKGIIFSCGDAKEASSETGETHKTALEESKKITAPALDPDKWELNFLLDYILNTHHQYIKDNAEMLNDLVQKVAEHHGDSNPELHRLSTSTHHFLQDLLDHIVKEEDALFPAIRQAIAKKNDASFETNYKIGTLNDPILILKKEHEIAGEDLSFFRRITHNYAIPENACNSYQYLFSKMQEFENDLLTHLHLENNILFPKAVKLDAELANL